MVYARVYHGGIYPGGVYAQYASLGTPTLHTVCMVNVPVDTFSAGRGPWAQRGGIPWVGGSQVPQDLKSVNSGVPLCAEFPALRGNNCG